MKTPSEFCMGDLRVSPRERLVWVCGSEVALTTREFDIVMMLAEHPGWVLSADQLSGDTPDGEYSPESVSVLVSRVRQKLATAGAVDVIETVRGLGYRLRASSDQPDGEAPVSEEGRRLRDAAWRLQEAVFEVEHTGTPDQRTAAADELTRARHAIYSRLAE